MLRQMYQCISISLKNTVPTDIFLWTLIPRPPFSADTARCGVTRVEQPSGVLLCRVINLANLRLVLKSNSRYCTPARQAEPQESIHRQRIQCMNQERQRHPQMAVESLGQTRLGSHCVRMSVSAPHEPMRHVLSEGVIVIGTLKPVEPLSVTDKTDE